MATVLILNAVNKVVSSILGNDIAGEWMKVENQQVLLNELTDVIQKCKTKVTLVDTNETKTEKLKEKSKKPEIQKPKKTNAYLEFCKEVRPALVGKSNVNEELIRMWNDVKKDKEEYKKYADIAKSCNVLSMTNMMTEDNDTDVAIDSLIVKTGEKKSIDEKTMEKLENNLDKKIGNEPVIEILSVKKIEDQINAWECLIEKEKTKSSLIMVHNSSGIAIRSLEFSDEIVRKVEKKIKKANGVVYDSTHVNEMFVRKVSVTQILNILESIAYEGEIVHLFKTIIIVTSQANKPELFHTNQKKWKPTDVLTKIKIN